MKCMISTAGRTGRRLSRWTEPAAAAGPLDPIAQFGEALLDRAERFAAAEHLPARGFDFGAIHISLQVGGGLYAARLSRAIAFAATRSSTGSAADHCPRWCCDRARVPFRLAFPGRPTGAITRRLHERPDLGLTAAGIPIREPGACSRHCTGWPRSGPPCGGIAGMGRPHLARRPALACGVGAGAAAPCRGDRAEQRQCPLPWPGRADRANRRPRRRPCWPVS